MKNKKLIILSVVSVLIISLGIGFYIFVPKQKSMPINIVTNNNAFVVQSIKLNNRTTSEDDLPSTENIPEANFIEKMNNFRRKYNENGYGDSVVKSVNATYKINENSNWGDKTVLMKDNNEIWSKMLIFTTFDPIRSYFATDSNVVLAYDHFPNNSMRERDVIIDGKSMNNKYSLQSSFASYKINSNIAYFAQKNNQYYLIFNDEFYVLSTSIKEIIDPPCCMPAAYAISAGDKEILFYSENQDGYWYQNKIIFK